jgi:hypothetical protein
MIRHSDPAMRQRPKLANAPNALLQAVVAEVERRVKSVDGREVTACADEINELLGNWDARLPTFYTNPRAPNKSLLISAELNAQRRATGRLPPTAWPTLNNMRSVEPSTRFRMAEGLNSALSAVVQATPSGPDQSPSQLPRWRKSNG